MLEDDLLHVLEDGQTLEQGVELEGTRRTAAIDEEITETGYIRPGLGDVGDRMYGTR